MPHKSSGQWLIIDPDYIVLRAAECMSASVHFCVDRCLWDVFPGSEPMFRPVYDKAFEHGAHVGIVEYGGTLARLECLRLNSGDLLVEVQSVPLERPQQLVSAWFHCKLCGDRFEDVLPPLFDLHWPSCCDIPSFLDELRVA